ncbi:unnamed protein product [Strongylus vulgaris]|uniref:Uncharacterized protein n=1 Tax=Strongylus vulgaris TaxID=40348 RepID=A0A3P7L4K8_STRVU|nr:unnamed protein product [Strongylus vulgaris]
MPKLRYCGRGWFRGTAAQLQAPEVLFYVCPSKDKLRSYFDGECTLHDLTLYTGLEKEAVAFILEKYNRDNIDKEAKVQEAPKKSSLPPGNLENRSLGNNVTFVIPKLDISDVRGDEASPDDVTPTPRDPVDQILHQPQPSQTPHQRQPSTVQRNLVESYQDQESTCLHNQSPREVPDSSAEISDLAKREQESTCLHNQSPREVPDSSAEISDLAKRLGARLFQDTSILEQLRSVKREKSFVDQLREIVASSSTSDSRKQLQFIPSTPVARRSVPPTVVYREIDVQTSIQIGELPQRKIELRDKATDLPSLDYLSISELGGLRQIPDTFIVQEDVSSSAFSSDQSAGQIPCNMISKEHTTITVNRDGSAVLTPSKNVRVSELMETAPLNSNQAIIHPVEDLSNAVLNASPRTPRISESPWRPSSRRLRLEEVDISTSQESNSIGGFYFPNSKVF